jgi:hypothetical protein
MAYQCCAFWLLGLRSMARRNSAFPFVVEQHLAQCGVRLRERVVQRQRVFGRGACLRHHLARAQTLRDGGAQPEVHPGLGQSRVRQRELRIDGDGAFHARHGFHQRVARALADEIAAADVVFIGIGIRGLALRHRWPFAACQRQRERGRDPDRNRIFEFESRARLRVEFLGP